MDTFKQRIINAGHFNRPVGFHKVTNQLVELKDIIHRTEDLILLKELNDSQKKELVTNRWKKGEWSDLYIGNDFIDLNRAIDEVLNDTVMGQILIEIGIRAVEMLLEDVNKSKMRGL